MINRFKEYLQKKGNIKEQYIPFYVRWVTECYSFLDVSDSTRINSNQKKQFLTYLGKRYQDWQLTRRFHHPHKTKPSMLLSFYSGMSLEKILKERLVLTESLKNNLIKHISEIRSLFNYDRVKNL